MDRTFLKRQNAGRAIEWKTIDEHLNAALAKSDEIKIKKAMSRIG
jgi:hypothetical protein